MSAIEIAVGDVVAERTVHLTRESLVRRVDNKLGQGAVWVTPNNNITTGYLTDFDADRISEAAFG